MPMCNLIPGQWLTARPHQRNGNRQHNDSNVLILGGRVVGKGLAYEIVNTWLETPFEGGRHSERLKKNR